jgi:hypothetical protein
MKPGAAVINADNIKLAIQAAWCIDDPAFALMLALREHSLRGLCLQCANGQRRLTQGRDEDLTIWLICRQCSRDETDKPAGHPQHRRLARIPVFVASIQTPPPLTALVAVNSLWLDTTEMRAHVRRQSSWSMARNSDELFELLGVEPDQIRRTMSSYAAAVEITDDDPSWDTVGPPDE